MSSIRANERQRFARDSFRFFTASPTRWGDCDSFGHINNVQFVRYYESGRLDYFQRLLGISATVDVHDTLIIADIQVNFLRQLHHPCALEVGTRISRLGNSSFDIESAIFAPGEDEPASTARAACVWFDYQENHSMPVPAAARATIAEFEGIEA